MVEVATGAVQAQATCPSLSAPPSLSLQLGDGIPSLPPKKTQTLGELLIRHVDSIQAFLSTLPPERLLEKVS